MLKLKKNKLKFLPDDIFDSLENLVKLSLSGNQLSTLNSKWFKNLAKLKTLSIGSNKIKELPTYAFKSLISLSYLKLDTNSLTTIGSESFGTHPNFVKFDFRRNKIISLDQNLFTNLKQIHGSRNPCVDENKSTREEDKLFMRRENL